MNPEVKQKWTTALLSGEYEQGKECLRSGDSYCCLGVLCDIYVKEHPQVEWKELDDEVATLFDEDETLPTIVREWAGLTLRDPYVDISQSEDNYECESLSSLNDGDWTFEQIADLIEKQL